MFRRFKYWRLARELKTADVARRTEIVERLASELRPADALKILRNAIMDGSPRVRHAAALALARFDEPEAAELLATAIPDEDLEIARTATRALLARNWQPHRSIEKRRMHIAHLIQQSEKGPRESRREAMLALARIDDPLASYEAPDSIIRQVAAEAAPESVAFLTHAAQSHGLAAAEIVQALAKILKTHRQRLPQSQLQELANLDGIAETEAYRERRPNLVAANDAESSHAKSKARGQETKAPSQPVVRYRVKRQISCRAIRDAARQELARRAAEREQRKKYFCPHCKLAIPLEKPPFGRRLRCPECQESHVCSEDNYC